MNNIDILEKFIKDYIEISHFCTEKTKVEIINVRKIVKAIQNLIAENKELKRENLEIRDWKYVIDSPIDLDKLKELDLIKIKGKE